jgi:hypothetical protein
VAVTLWLERNLLNRGPLTQPTGRSCSKFSGISRGHNPAGTEIWLNGRPPFIWEKRQGEIDQSMGWINQLNARWQQIAQHRLEQRVVAAAQNDGFDACIQKGFEIALRCSPQGRCVELMGLHSRNKGGTTHLNDG